MTTTTAPDVIATVPKDAVPAPLRAPAAPLQPQPPDEFGAVLDAVSQSLVRRGMLTTEFWVTVIGAVLSTLLALVHVSGPTAAQIVATAGPAVLAGAYAVIRGLHKSRLAQIVTALYPQYQQNP